MNHGDLTHSLLALGFAHNCRFEMSRVNSGYDSHFIYWSANLFSANVQNSDILHFNGWVIFQGYHWVDNMREACSWSGKANSLKY